MGCNLKKKLDRLRLNPSDTQELKKITEELTPEWVLNVLKRKVSDSKRDADQIRATELIGKYLQMFKDFSTTEVKQITPRTEEDLDKEFRTISEKYRSEQEEISTTT